MNLTSFIETVARAPSASSLSPQPGALDAVEAEMLQLCGDDEVVGRIAREQLKNGGKRIRARLALAAAAALGVEDEDARSWAVAVEILHNATLVHDDVQDGDVYRRGRRTAWAAHGVPQAINVGDLMLMLPALAIDGIDVGGAVRQCLTRALFSAAVETVRGQGADLALRTTLDSADVDVVAAYMRCIEAKTGALFALPVTGAALLAGQPPENARALSSPFAHLGVLFQLQDDVLDLFGDKGRDARGSDIREGKISALVVEHLRLHPAERSWLLRILDAPRDATADADVDAVIARFDDGGAKDAVVARIASLCTLAVHEAAPPLHSIVVDLIARVLAPIQHCFGDHHAFS